MMPASKGTSGKALEMTFLSEAQLETARSRADGAAAGRSAIGELAILNSGMGQVGPSRSKSFAD